MSDTSVVSEGWSNVPRFLHRLRSASRRRRHTGLLLVAAAGLLTTAIVLVGKSMGHAQTVPENFIPQDAAATCVVSKAEFESWFNDKGLIQPADSVNFPDNKNCDFYKWSEQMFLWLTAPDPASKNGGRIIDSAEFYDVSPPDAKGERTFLPHVSGGGPRTFSVRSAQAGPRGLPVLFDKAGKMFEVAPSRKAPSGNPLLLNKLGKLIEVASVRMKDGKPVFLDKTGHPIASPKPVPDALTALPASPLSGAKDIIATAYELMIGKTSIFLDADGGVINTGVGQAGTHGVLMAQNGSLVYYVTMVNDVFAYFLTGAKNGCLKPTPSQLHTTQAELEKANTLEQRCSYPAPTQFPTTGAELGEIKAFASWAGKSLKNPQALAIEVKSSWVEAKGLPNPEDYITMEAIIPDYDRTNPTKWVLKGSRPARLAMVGMHIVGSAKGNPEMLWATFEHFGNTPNAAYDYVASNGSTKRVAQNTAGTWLFSESHAAGTFNSPHMKAAGSAINAVEHYMISHSDTLRMHPWGAAENLKPNGKVASTAASNSEIIAINNSVLRQLSAGDVRKNYFMLGNTWTKGGKAPIGQYPGSGEQLDGQEIGTSRLSNSTMETYDQGTTSTGSNCFDCHSLKFENRPLTDVSHIYEDLMPLFPPG